MFQAAQCCLYPHPVLVVLLRVCGTCLSRRMQAKSWKDTNAGLDASNKDKKINMQKWPIYGMLMPDTVQIYTAADGIEYLVTANEGDDRASAARQDVILLME